eukprot:gene24793-31172_t
MSYRLYSLEGLDLGLSIKGIDDEIIFYRYNVEKTIAWLKKKVQATSATLLKHRLSKAQTVNPSFSSNFDISGQSNKQSSSTSAATGTTEPEEEDIKLALDILCEYLSDSLLSRLLSEYKYNAKTDLVKKGASSASEGSGKRKADWEDELELEKETLAYSSTATTNKTAKPTTDMAGYSLKTLASLQSSQTKHRKQQLGIEDSNDVIPRPEKYVYQPVLEKRQKELLQSEAMALIEMEEKLSELKRVKEGRKRRTEQRSVNKLKYKSAETIRRAYKRFVNRKYTGAMDVILAFMRATAHKQALTTAVWAIGVIRKFSWKAVFHWRKKQFQRQAIRQCAQMNWDFIAEFACVWTLARRTVADECVFNALKVGTQNTKQYILATDGWVPPVASQKSSAANKTRSFSQNTSSKQRAPSFFLTSGGDMDFQERDEDNMSVTEKLQRFQHVQQQSNANKGGVGVGPSKHHAKPNNPLATTAASSAMSEAVKKKKVYDDKNEQVKRLMELHRIKLQEMENERLRRIRLLEQQAKLKESAPPPEPQPEVKKKQPVVVSKPSPSTHSVKVLHHSQSVQNSTDDSHLHTSSSSSTTVTANNSSSSSGGDISSGEVFLDQHLGAVPSSAPHATRDSHNHFTQNNSNGSNNSMNPPTTSASAAPHPTRTSSTSKVVSKILNAMASANSTEDRDRLVRDNNRDMQQQHQQAGGEGDSNANTNNNSNHSKRRSDGLQHHAHSTKPYVSAANDQQQQPVVVIVKRPAVPSQAGVVSAQKEKQEKEAEELKEQLRLLEVTRFNQFNSEEALKKSRQAMQRRVALKAQRVMQKQKEEEEEEVARKEKLEQLAADARKQLLLAKVRFAEKSTAANKKSDKQHINGKKEIGGVVGKQKKKKRHQSNTVKDSNPSEPAGANRNIDDEDGHHHNLDNNTQYHNSQDNDDENGEEEGEGSESECDVFDVNALLNREEEDEDEEDDDNNNNNEEEDEDDSLSLDMNHITRAIDSASKLRGMSGGGGGSGRKTHSPSSSTAESRQQLGGGEEDSLAAAAAGGGGGGGSGSDSKPGQFERVDTQMITPQLHIMNSNSSRAVKFAPETVDTTSQSPPISPSYTREVHHISSAREDYSDLIEDFAVETFFSDGGGDSKPSLPSKTSAVTVNIPKHLQNTPYFVDYKKHSKPDGESVVQNGSHNKKSNGVSGNKVKNSSKGQQPQKPAKSSLHSKRDDEEEDDVSVESHPPNKKSLGRVASLMEMVDRARQKQADAQTLHAQHVTVPMDSPPKPPYLMQHNENNNLNGGGSSYSYLQPSAAAAPPPLSIPPTHMHTNNGPHSAYGNTPTNNNNNGVAVGGGSVVPLMSFKKFQAMSPSIPLPPIGNTGGLTFKSNKVTGAVSVVNEKKATTTIGGSANPSKVALGSSQQQQPQRHSRVQKGKTLDSTANSSEAFNTNNAPSHAGTDKKKKVKKYHKVAPRGGPVFDHTPQNDSDHSDNEDDEEEDEEQRALQREYDEKRSAFARRLAEATSATASVNASYNNTALNSAHNSPRGHVTSDSKIITSTQQQQQQQQQQ